MTSTAGSWLARSQCVPRAPAPPARWPLWREPRQDPLGERATGQRKPQHAKDERQDGKQREESRAFKRKRHRLLHQRRWNSHHSIASRARAAGGSQGAAPARKASGFQAGARRSRRASIQTRRDSIRGGGKDSRQRVMVSLSSVPADRCPFDSPLSELGLPDPRVARPRSGARSRARAPARYRDPASTARVRPARAPRREAARARYPPRELPRDTGSRWR